jgi:uncharacterized protein
MHLTLEHSFATAVTPSMRVLETAAMFGLGVDDTHHLALVPRIELHLPVPGPGVVFITGPSGGGKSTILRLIAHGCRERGHRVIDLDDLPPLPDRPLVDAFELSLEETMSVLAFAGLGEAFLMLRRPCELSDGQKWRLRLAQAMCARGAVIIADEFAAALDRLTARIIARSVRRWTRRSGATFICATTHDDLLEALEPDVLIHKGFGGEIEVARR